MSQETEQLTDRYFIFLASLASSTHTVSIKLSGVKSSQAAFEAWARSQPGLESKVLSVRMHLPLSVCCSLEQGSSALGSTKNTPLTPFALFQERDLVWSLQTHVLMIPLLTQKLHLVLRRHSAGFGTAASSTSSPEPILRDIPAPWAALFIDVWYL